MAKYNKEQLEQLIDKGVGKVNYQWVNMSLLAGHVLRHCYENKHDTSLIKRMYTRLVSTDWKALTESFKNAAWEIVGVDIIIDKANKQNPISCKLDQEQWKKVKEKHNEKMDLLLSEGSGLRAFKKSKRGTGGKKNGPVKEGVAITFSEIEKLDKQWKELNPKDEHLVELRKKADDLLKQYKEAFDLFKAVQEELAKKIQPTPIKEEASEVDSLDKDLPKLDEAS